MKVDYSEIVGCSSINQPNTWYLFRPNGVEITIEMIDGKLKSDRKLTDLELEYLDKNLK